MSSITHMANVALGRLGQPPIVHVDDATAAARAVKLALPLVLDEVLRSHRWNFATARRTLTRLSEAPVFGWSYAFELPERCVRVLEFNGKATSDREGSYTLEGRKLLTNAEDVQLVYIERPSSWSDPVWTAADALFVKAASLKLAAEVCTKLSGSREQEQRFLEEYERLAAGLARRVDANENGRRFNLRDEMLAGSSFVKARGS